MEAMLVVAASCLVGALIALLIYVVWSWPSVELFGQVGPVRDAGASVLVFVPVASFFLSYMETRYRVRKIIKLSTVGAVTGQLSGLDLKSLGKPLKVRLWGSAFNLATRNVSRDRELNGTLVRVSLCIFLSVVALTGALVSADTSRNYVQRAMPANVLLIANGAVYDQYVKIGTAFSSTEAIPSFNYTEGRFIINQTLVSSLRAVSGVKRVDARLITMASVSGYIKAHLVTNETSGNFNNQYVSEVYLGSAQAVLVGIDASNAVGDWYTSDGFLQVSDTQDTVIAGDSLVGGIVQSPFSLAQVGAFGIRYDVKGALVDPLNAGRVLYAPVQSLQNALSANGYNVLLVETDNNPVTVRAVEQVATSSGLAVGSMNGVLSSNLSFLENTWSFFLILPVMTLALTCGTLLSYLTTNFSRRFNDYLVLRILGARAWYSLRLFLWEAWGLLAVCMVIAIPLAWLVSIFFLVPEPNASTSDQLLAAIVPIAALSAVSVSSAMIYSRRLRLMTVKDLRT